MFFEKKHKFRYSIKGLLALEINYTLVSLAMQMISSFGVVFVYLLGRNQTMGVIYVLLYFGLQRVLVMANTSLVGVFINRFGYRWTTLSALVVASAKLLVLSAITPERWTLLLLAAFLGGWHLAAYEISYNGLFLEDNDDGKIGEQSGMLELWANLAGLVSPLIAGFVVEWWGFGVLFVLATVMLLISTIPLFFTPHHKKNHKKFSLKQSLSILDEEREMFGPVFWWYFQDAFNLFFWPVFLYLLLKDFAWLGVVGSLTLLASAIANYFAGKIYDKRPLKRVHPVFSIIMGLSWVLMWFADTGILAGAAQAMRKLNSPFWWMKIKRFALQKGETLNSLVYGAAWEWVTSLAYVLGLVVGCGILLLGLKWQWMLLPTLLAVAASSILIEKIDRR